MRKQPAIIICLHASLPLVLSGVKIGGHFLVPLLAQITQDKILIESRQKNIQVGQPLLGLFHSLPIFTDIAFLVRVSLKDLWKSSNVNGLQAASKAFIL